MNTSVTVYSSSLSPMMVFSNSIPGNCRPILKSQVSYFQRLPQQLPGSTQVLHKCLWDEDSKKGRKVQKSSFYECLPIIAYSVRARNYSKCFTWILPLSPLNNSMRQIQSVCSFNKTKSSDKIICKSLIIQLITVRNRIETQWFFFFFFCVILPLDVATGSSVQYKRKEGKNGYQQRIMTANV